MKIARLSEHLAAVLLAATALATLLGFLNSVLWLGELCSHFRVQYAGAALLIGILSAVRRRPPLAAAAILVVAVNAAVVLAAWRHSTGVLAPQGGPRLTVVSFNIEYTNPDFAAVRSYLSARHPDVIVLAELTPEWVRQLAELTHDYPYRLTQSRDSAWGLGVYSRYPLTDARFLELGLSGSVNVAATLEVSGHQVGLFAVHLSSPTSPARTGARNDQLVALAGALRSFREVRPGTPRLVLGDFNVTPFSPVFLDLLRTTGTRNVRLGFPGPGTWPSWMPPAAIPIDHCVTDPQLRPVEASRGPPSGSDHYPIEFSFEFVG